MSMVRVLFFAIVWGFFALPAKAQDALPPELAVVTSNLVITGKAYGEMADFRPSAIINDTIVWRGKIYAMNGDEGDPGISERIILREATKEQIHSSRRNCQLLYLVDVSKEGVYLIYKPIFGDSVEFIKDIKAGGAR